MKEERTDLKLQYMKFIWNLIQMNCKKMFIRQSAKSNTDGYFINLRFSNRFFFFFFGCAMQHAGSLFLNQGLNLGHHSGIAEF